MATLDWWVIGTYLLSMLLLAAWLGRRQESRRDYYLAGGSLPPSALATSIIATQCSTNSLLGAPAFVGFTLGGGLIWLQYELAVPLAMLGLAFLFPAVHRSGAISIYSYLETRLGREARLTASACFLFFRGVATGVTVYGVASVLALVTGISYLWAVILLMVVTIAYDVMGGMRAVVVSDVVQMLLLVGAVMFSLLWLSPLLIEESSALGTRIEPLMNDWGVSGASNFGFWPMLFGGLFLYMAYYGCDQSQAQRLLAASDEKSLQRVLFLNGVLRFPLVLAYCLLGLGLAAYALQEPSFLDDLPLTSGGAPNLNLVFPVFVQREFAPGLAGLAIVGLFAAAMSSIDSALNSLSASTLEDFVRPSVDGSAAAETRFFRLSKLITLAWGVFAVLFSFTVEHIAATILEAINKVSSMANGPLLALFLLAIACPRTRGRAVVIAFVGGLCFNAYLWIQVPALSWLWWNVTGFVVTVVLALIFKLSGAAPAGAASESEITIPTTRLTLWLCVAFLVMLALLGVLQHLAQG